MKVSQNNPDQSPKHTTSRIRVRFTKSGLLFLLVAILIGTAAIKGRSPMMLVIFTMMSAAIAISVLISRNNLARIRLKRDIPPRIWQHQKVQLGYYLRNTNRRKDVLGLTISERAPIGIHSISGYCLSIPAMRNFRAQATLNPARRGKILLKQVKISTIFPFGLVCASRYVRQNNRLVVWPARGKLKSQLLFRGAIETSQAAPSQASGGQDDFFGLREYRPGDNPRWIHWKSSALKNTPIIREMSKPLPEQVWVVIDTYLSDLSELAYHNREKTLQFAVTLIDYAFRHSYEVGLVVADNDGTKIIPAASGKTQRTICLDTIATTGNNTRVPLEKALQDVRPNTFRHAQLVAASPHSDNVSPDTINFLRSRSRHLTMITPSNIDAVFEDRANLRE